MPDKLKILGISGSLRKDSYNTGLLRAAAKLLPPDVELEIVSIGGIPPFNQDLEANMPPAVSDLKTKIKSADAIFIATPEYNYSISGVLKNAIDWTSRPYGDNSWDGKPAAIMSASAGTLGGIRAQYHLRQIFVSLNVHVLNRPEVAVPSAAGKFDEAGNLTDEMTKTKVKELLEALAAWSRKLRL